MSNTATDLSDFTSLANELADRLYNIVQEFTDISGLGDYLEGVAKNPGSGDGRDFGIVISVTSMNPVNPEEDSMLHCGSVMGSMGALIECLAGATKFVMDEVVGLPTPLKRMQAAVATLETLAKMADEIKAYIYMQAQTHPAEFNVRTVMPGTDTEQ